MKRASKDPSTFFFSQKNYLAKTIDTFSASRGQGVKQAEKQEKIITIGIAFIIAGLAHDFLALYTNILPAIWYYQVFVIEGIGILLCFYGFRHDKSFLLRMLVIIFSFFIVEIYFQEQLVRLLTI